MASTEGLASALWDQGVLRFCAGRYRSHGGVGVARHASQSTLGVCAADAPVPWLSTGLSPVLQWLILPPLILWISRHHLPISEVISKGSK